MSVYPEFLQYIHDQGLYVHGYNYEEMYNIMIYTLTHNIIPTTNFIYTYQQVDQLYECLEELLTPLDTDIDTDETNEPQSQIQNNQNTNTDTIITIENPLDNFDDIYENDETQVQPVESVEPQQYTENEPDAQTVFNNYIHILNNAANINNSNMNQMNNMNNTNQNVYTNLTYYNNTNSYNNTYNMNT